MPILNEVKTIIESGYPHTDVLYSKWKVKFRDEHFEKIYWDCYPFMDKYFFEANPSYLYEYEDMFDLGRYPLVMLRDGFLGILDLFFLHPKPPKDFASIILIHKKFEKLVPKMWLKHTACYQVLPRKEDKIFNTENQDLLIYGHATSETYWDQNIETIFKNLEQKIEKFKHLYFLLPHRNVELVRSGSSLFKNYIDLARYVVDKFPDKARLFNDINTFLEIFKKKNFSFYNLDSAKIFNADNNLDHRFYSKNWTNISEVSYDQKEEDLEFNLSIGHKVVISNVNVEDNKFSEFYLNYKMSGKKTTSIYELALMSSIKETYQKSFLI